MNFKEELENYKPIEGIEASNKAEALEDIQDLMDLLSHSTKEKKTAE